jgi:hypothetical protein
MGVKTHIKKYDTYVKRCKKKKIKPIDFIEFIIITEG